MIKARMENTVFLGLDRENINRLLDNQPIHINGSEVGITQDIVIVANETLNDCIEDLRALGLPIPK